MSQFPTKSGRRRFLSFSCGAALAAAPLSTAPGDALAFTNPDGNGTSADTDVITLFLCGDVMIGRGIDQVLPYPGNPRICEPFSDSALDYVRLAEKANGPIVRPVDSAYIWGDALRELECAAPDLRIINLETSVTMSEDCTDKGISYRMNPENVGCLTAAEIDCCVLANNHVLDWGRAGLIETLETLKGAGISYTGAGRSLREAAAPTVLEVPNKGRAIVFAFGSVTSGIPKGWGATEGQAGVNLLTDMSDGQVSRIAAQVSRAKRLGDIVVASIHWGSNWGYQVSDRQRNFAHALIDRADVDIVHGHSSHHPRPIEVYKQKLILYGCGDFLNDYEGISGYEEFRDDLVLMYLVSLGTSTGSLVACELVPFQIKNFQLNVASIEDAHWLKDVLDRESEAFGTKVTLTETSALMLQWQ